MKIIILVLSQNDGGIYSKFTQTQKETWDIDVVEGVDTFYFFGNEKIDLIQGNSIFTTINEGLYSCGLKTVRAFELIKNFDFDFVFRTNASSYVDKFLLKDFLLKKNNVNHYSGVIGNHQGINFASGSGFVISKDVLNLILEFKHELNHSYIDDVSFAELLLRKKITPTLNERYDVVNDNLIPENFFHYRLKTANRYFDINNMYKIKNLKDGFYNRK
jgi:hypothetical protein